MTDFGFTLGATVHFTMAEPDFYRERLHEPVRWLRGGVYAAVITEIVDPGQFIVHLKMWTASGGYCNRSFVNFSEEPREGFWHLPKAYTTWPQLAGTAAHPHGGHAYDAGHGAEIIDTPTQEPQPFDAQDPALTRKHGRGSTKP